MMGAATLIPWAFGLMMAPMLFDSPDSSTKLFPYLIIVGLLLYPVLMGFCFWHAWKMADMRMALLASSLPLILDIILLFYIFAS